MIKVLIVDDSQSARQLLTEILNSAPDIHVVGTAGNGLEALEAIKRVRPDVITMDIYMPLMDGFETTSRILETDPIPIIIVSACYTAEEVEKTFMAIGVGALAILPKPRITDLTYKESAKEIVQTVRLMSEVKVVTRRSRLPRKGTENGKPLCIVTRGLPLNATAIRAVVMGASTGGPPVLQTILSLLPPDFPVPVLVVQHIASGFLQGMIDWLGQTVSLPISIALHGEPAQPGHIYFAPDGCHMSIAGDNRMLLSTEPPENGMRPSISHLFRSAAGSLRRHAAGVLLTGMGKDGAVELKLMRDRGAVTIAQDEESSVIYGMPGEAVKLEGALYVLPPDSIAEILKGVVQQ
jgi:two-component system chemotaxis response regulator CheB